MGNRSCTVQTNSNKKRMNISVQKGRKSVKKGFSGKVEVLNPTAALPHTLDYLCKSSINKTPVFTQQR